MGDFSVIQDAIDFASTAGASLTEPWIIKICPGTYAERLTLPDYISLVGLGTKDDGVHISYVDGAVLEFLGDDRAAIENISLHAVAPHLSSTAMALKHTGGGHLYVNNCFMDRYDEEESLTGGPLVQILTNQGGAGLTIEDSVLDYEQAEDGVSAHALFDFNTARFFNFRFVNSKATIDSGSLQANYMFWLQPGTIFNRWEVGYNQFRQNNDTAPVSPSGIFFFCYGVNTKSPFYFHHNHYEYDESNTEPGSAWIYYDGGVENFQIRSTHNHFASISETGQTGRLYNAGFGVAGASLNAMFDELKDIQCPQPIPATVWLDVQGDANYLTDGNIHYSAHPTSDDPPNVRVSTNVPQAGLPGVPQTISWNIQDYDSAEVRDFPPNGMFGPAPSATITVLVDGTYDIKCSLIFEADIFTSVDEVELEYWVSINGSAGPPYGHDTLQGHTGGDHHHITVTLVDRQPLLAGDVIVVQWQWSAGNPATACFLAGEVRGTFISLEKDS